MEHAYLSFGGEMVHLKDAEGTSFKPGCYLKGKLVLAGCAMHVDAIAVVERNGIQEADDPAMQETMDDWYSASGAYEPLQTVKIQGRRFVLFVYPYGT